MWQLSRQNMSRQIIDHKFFEPKYLPFEKHWSWSDPTQGLLPSQANRYHPAKFAGDTTEFQFIMNHGTTPGVQWVLWTKLFKGKKSLVPDRNTLVYRKGKHYIDIQ